MLKRCNHIVVAVRDLSASAERWQQQLGVEPRRWGESKALGARRAQFDVGDAYFALCEPLSDKSRFERFLQTRGEGVFAVGFDVDDLASTAQSMAGRGVSFSGSEDAGSLWLHPRQTHGLNLGLFQESDARSALPGPLTGFRAFVVAVSDLDTALRDWTTILGAGPLAEARFPVGDTGAEIVLSAGVGHDGLHEILLTADHESDADAGPLGYLDVEALNGVRIGLVPDITDVGAKCTGAANGRWARK